MSRNREMHSRINRLHEKALRIVYQDEKKSSFQQLLNKDESVTIHQRNLKLLTYKIFQQKKMSAEIINKILKFKEPH